MKTLLGIDFGGSSTKATLLGVDGTILAEHSVEYPTYYPSLGFCEQKPEDWVKALCENVRALLTKSGADPHDILAVAVDSATHTWVATDDAFRPLFPAIHWTDSRSRDEASHLKAEAGEMIFQKTFHKPDTIWTLPQMLWVKEHLPEAFGKIRHVMFEKDYLRLFLTGTYGTDTIDAQGSMLFDCTKMAWSDELMHLSGLSMDVLPECDNARDVIGSVTEEAARLTGLVCGTPVLAGTTDTVMEIFASGAVSYGDATVKLATAGRICVMTDRPYPDRDLVNYSHVVPGLWYPGSATKAAASSLRWYRDTFGGDYRELDEAAAKIPVGSVGLVFHPYINGELTPYADPDLCGSFTGIRATHTKAHFTRAVLEGVAFSLMASEKKLRELRLPLADHATLIGGGAKSPLWQSIVSDALGLKLTVTESSDSSLGSAMLAGLSVGAFASPRDAVNAAVKIKKTITPNEENTKKYQSLFAEYEAIHDGLAPIYRERGK